MKQVINLCAGLFLILCLSLTAGANSSTLATISVQSGSYERFDTPVSLSLENVTSVNESELRLYEIVDGALLNVPIQFSSGEQRYLHWLLGGRTGPGETRTFRLIREEASPHTGLTRIEKEQDSYLFYSGEKPVLKYNSGIMLPPEGTNPAYRRSGFIHPLYSPSKAVLTNIQPADHLHHYGIWNPWTKTTFRGEEIDFWNLAKEQGRVRFAGLASLNQGDVFSSIQVLHEHVVWPYSLRETIAMNELQEIKVFSRSDGTFIIEISSRLSPVEQLILEEYRYGGFVLRATDEWTNQNSYLFTSEGLNRDNADGQRARWVVVSGETAPGKASVMMMGHPANYNHPEPVRVWDSKGNRGRGDHFINFSPTRNTQWELNPGINYLLRYRMLVFDGEIDDKRAEMLWNDFSNPPVITVKK
jgi:hypothetical protein